MSQIVEWFKRGTGRRKQEAAASIDRGVIKKENHTNETAEEKQKRLREKLFASHCKDLQKMFERLKRQDVYGHFLLPVTEEVDRICRAHIESNGLSNREIRSTKTI